MKNLQELQFKLAAEIIDFIGTSTWDSAGSNTSIYGTMTQTSYWRERAGEMVQNDRLPAMEYSGAASRAVLAFRDEVLSTKGDRIWGLGFILYPSGKFKIEYDYKKPDDYEEDNRPVELEEVIKDLQRLGAKVDVVDPKK